MVFFLGYFENQTPRHNEGFEDMSYELVSYDEAMKLLTFDNTKRILKRANDFLTKQKEKKS